MPVDDSYHYGFFVLYLYFIKLETINTKTMTKQMNVRIEMHLEEGHKAKRNYDQTITAIRPLGKEIKISPKSYVTINKPGFKAEYYVETVSVLIGIGADHTAELIMDTESWEALKDGAQLSIETVKDFRKRMDI